MILYYITDRRQFSGDFLSKVSEAISAGVDYIQLREKDLSSRGQEELGTKIQKLKTNFPTQVLINARVDVARAAGVQGVHLPANEISVKEVRRIWREAVIGVSCHSKEEVRKAAEEGANFAVFGPVFEKGTAAPQGLDRLSEASQNPIPVLALGGITLANAKSCVDAGAVGIAAIRLFQETNVAEVVAALRPAAKPR
ncbi:MAG TPA: thiamine phosphate synthase [Terriglobales bacterium]|nr:thiamine phosphate synthase [Terriglobales bacterium]